MPGPRQGVVAIIRREQRLLVIQRSALVRAPLAYCFPGGGIEPGESEVTALCRELQEELGAAIHPQRCVWRSMTRSHVSLAWWTAHLVDPRLPFRPSEHEVASFQWLQIADILSLPNLLESNHEFLNGVLNGEIVLDHPS